MPARAGRGGWHPCYSCITMIAVRLPPAIEKRLDRLARSTGRTKTFYVREAILQHLEDLEDIYAADAVLRRVRSGQESVVKLKDVLQQHGLDG